MRIGGVPVDGPCEEVLVLPRPTSQDLVFRARAVLDTEEFDQLCPQPVMPQRIVKGGREDNPDSPAFVEAMKLWGERRFAWICLKSLEPSEIEWDKVDLKKPSSWLGWQKELTDAGFSSVEVKRILACIMQANSLDENKLRMARESFLLGQGVRQLASSGQDTEQASTQSGPPANDSE